MWIPEARILKKRIHISFPIHPLCILYFFFLFCLYVCKHDNLSEAVGFISVGGIGSMKCLAVIHSGLVVSSFDLLPADEETLMGVYFYKICIIIFDLNWCSFIFLPVFSWWKVCVHLAHVYLWGWKKIFVKNIYFITRFKVCNIFTNFVFSQIVSQCAQIFIPSTRLFALCPNFTHYK